ncbi:MAG: FG-GAP-like repeat-containing protein [Flavobacteriales bacterium]
MPSQKQILILLVTIVGMACQCAAQFVLSNPIDNCSTIYINFGVGISTHDFDRDGLDDITICDAPCGVRAFRNLGNGQFELYYDFASLNIAKCPIWVDYDNDGDSDFFFTCDNSMIQLYRNEGNGAFSNVTTSLVSTQAVARSMGASWGDYDRDGWLDLYVCNYNFLNAHNWLFHNNGDGTFDEVSVQMGVDNGFRFSFQSTWCDLNQDGWQDLYVVNDLADTNTFYLNQSGVFAESSALYGLDMVLNSMSNSISDYDNDGDFDIYISGTPQGNFLMRNDNGVFANVVEGTELVLNEWCWSGLWIDYDNDSDDDLHVSTRGLPNFPAQNPFYVNEEGSLETINLYGLQGDFFESLCAAKGDFNNDGLWDFAVANQAPTSTNLWTNILQVQGHWIKFGLEGTVSNRDGVGSIVRCYHGSEMNLLQTYCGENYMSQDSQYEIIGLANDMLVDSLIVTWPSGWVDRYYNLTEGFTYAFVEGETYHATILSSNGNNFCNGEVSTTLTADSGETFLWSDGSEDSFLFVTQSGEYNVQVTNAFGFQSADTIAIYSNEDPLLGANLFQPNCTGDQNGLISLEFQNEDSVSLLWNDGSIDFALDSLGAGSYAVQILTSQGCIYNHSFALEEPVQIESTFSFEPIVCFGDSTVILIQNSGGAGELVTSWSNSDPLAAFAGEHIYTVTDSMGCVFSDTILIEQPDPIQVLNETYMVCPGNSACVEVEIIGGTPPFELDWFGVDSCALFAGTHALQIQDVYGCPLTESIEVAEWPAPLIDLALVDPFDGANGSIELLLEGGVPPFTFQWNNGDTTNPIQNIGQGTYQCNITDSVGCVIQSPVAEMLDSAVEATSSKGGIDIFPNPFNDNLKFGPKFQFGQKTLSIYNASGDLIWEGLPQSCSAKIDTVEWPSGIYLATCGSARVLLVKQ